MKKTALMTTVLLTAGAAGYAVAEMDYEEYTEANNAGLFRVLDIDGDGVLTRGEVTAYPELENIFGHLDRNGNQELSNAEFGEFNPTPSMVEDVVNSQSNSGSSSDWDSDMDTDTDY